MIRISARMLMATCLMSATAGAVGYNVGRQAFTPPVVVYEVREVHDFDITDPWERCLAAMEAAEIPGDMWECHEK